MYQLFEVVVGDDMLRAPHENESDAISAISATRETIAINAGHFMRFRMVIIVNCAIDSGSLYFLSWLENFQCFPHRLPRMEALLGAETLTVALN